MKQETKNNFNLWEYLYYRTTQLYKRVETEVGFSANKNRGAFLVALCISLNLWTLLLFLLTIIIGTEFKELGNSGTLEYFFGGLFIVILLVCLYFFANKRHEMIFKKYENESPTQRENRKWIALAYVLFSFTALSVLVFLGRDFVASL